MNNSEAKELTTKSAATASSLGVIDQFGNVVTRYHDQVVISKNPRHAAMLMDVLTLIMEQSLENKAKSAPPKGD
jgi:hypothetical protein